jgi:hypothetical protein
MHPARAHLDRVVRHLRARDPSTHPRRWSGSSSTDGRRAAAARGSGSTCSAGVFRYVHAAQPTDAQREELQESVQGLVCYAY